MTERRKKILAVSSGGGHWVQLRRVQAAFEAFDASYATVHADYEADVPARARFYVLRDATRWDRWALVVLLLQIVRILLRERPDVVISTGAAPGYFALRIGKMLGAKTIWLDSIANVEEVSLSGRRIAKHADLWLTQWPHLATKDGPTYLGSVL